MLRNATAVLLAAEQALAAKEGKLELEKAKIEAMKREAAERFDHAIVGTLRAAELTSRRGSP